MGPKILKLAEREPLSIALAQADATFIETKPQTLFTLNCYHDDSLALNYIPAEPKVSNRMKVVPPWMLRESKRR